MTSLEGWSSTIELHPQHNEANCNGEVPIVNWKRQNPSKSHFGIWVGRASPATCRAANSPYRIRGLLPDPEGGLSDITGLYLDKSSLLPADQRSFIRTVQQIKGWRDLPPNYLRPRPYPTGRATAKASPNPSFSSASLGCARPGRAISPSTPPVFPIIMALTRNVTSIHARRSTRAHTKPVGISPCNPPVIPLYSPSTPPLLPLYSPSIRIQGE